MMLVRRVVTRGKLGILELGTKARIPDFGRFNLIYGWNRSGKTTFSRIFEACEQRSVEFKEYPNGGGFQLTTDSGAQVTSDSIEACNLSVRVFNQDFIDRNVSFDSSTCKGIVYISEKSVSDQALLAKLSAEEETLLAKKDRLQKDEAATELEIARFLENTALQIKNTVGNYRQQDQYRSYDRRNLKRLLEGKDATAFVALAESEFDSMRELALSDDPKMKCQTLDQFSISSSVPGERALDLDSLHRKLCEVTTRKVIAESLSRLRDDPELSMWVRAGLRLQRERRRPESCPYCETELGPDFIEKLSRHFSEDYESLLLDLGKWIEGIKRVTPTDLPAEVDLYPECIAAYLELAASHARIVAELRSWVEECDLILQSRLQNPARPMKAPPAPPPSFRARYDDIVVKLNRVFREHNDRAANHAGEVSERKRRLAGHVVAEALQGQDYYSRIGALDIQKNRLAAAKGALAEHRRVMERLRRSQTDIGAAVDEINGHLSGFFGGDEIVLELDNKAKGYSIRRNGGIADNLSEGEKTALAFSYFLTKTREGEFLISEGVVVIDDPVSSLDSNYTHYCFALMQRHFGGVGQLFVLTHNFDLFGLVKSWFKSKNRNVRRSRKSAEPCFFYVLEVSTVGGRRVGSIAEMDATLRDYNSEYQYLFGQLCRFDDGALGYGDLYVVGNIARRFLEIYTGFKVPKPTDLRTRVERLKTDTITGVQKDRIYRLVQVYSHADDPTCVVAHKDKGEVQEAIRILLRLVEESDPEHYRILRGSLPSCREE